MRISDWSSDVCSSDLSVIACHRTPSQKCPGNKHHHENECCACGKIHIIPHFPGLQLLNSVLVQLACTPIPGAPALPTSKLAPVPDPASSQEWETLAPLDCAPTPTIAPPDHPSDQPQNTFNLLSFIPPGQ